MRLPDSFYLSLIALTAPFTVSLPSQAQDIPLYSSQFTDTKTHWANLCIEGMGAEGVMKGYLDKSFRPNGTMTRTEFAATMIKAFPDAAKVREAPDFADVDANFWGKDAIANAYEKGFLTGYLDNTFKPAQPITRAQAIIVIAKAQQFTSEGLLEEDIDARLQQYYDDAEAIPNYARGAIALATQLGFVVNYPTVSQLRPTANITRSEATALFCRLNAARSDARYYVPAQYIPNMEDWTLSRDFTLKPATVLQEGVGAVSGLLHTTATLNQQLFFFMNESASGSDLWASDGTVAGTTVVTKLQATEEESGGKVGLNHPQVIASDDQRFWLSERKFESDRSSDSLWVSDGSAEGTRLVISLSPTLQQLLRGADTSLSVEPNTQFNHRFPFAVNTPAGSQLWITDGIDAAGTQLLADFSYPNETPGYQPLTLFPATEQYLFFLRGTQDIENWLWRSDGTVAGTIQLASIEPITAATHGNRAYFSVIAQGTGQELWTSDGTPKGTTLVKDIHPGEASSQPKLLTHLGDRFFLLAQSPEGFGLWQTQGTPESTQLVKKLGAEFAYRSKELFTVYQDQLLFNVEVRQAVQQNNGSEEIQNISELWTTDGTASGTQRLTTVAAQANSFTLFKGQLFFVGDGGDGKELWATDGTPENTRQVIDLIPGTDTFMPPPCPAPPPGQDVPGYCQPEEVARSANVRSLTVHGDFLYFIADDTSLMRTDGTAQGIQLVKRFTGGPIHDFPPNIVKLSNTLLVMGYEEGTILLWALPE